MSYSLQLATRGSFASAQEDDNFTKVGAEARNSPQQIIYAKQN